MNHLEAEKEYLAEGYALGELDTSERQAFELHMKSCSICAEETQLAITFVATFKEILQEERSRRTNADGQKNRCRAFVRRHRQKSQ